MTRRGQLIALGGAALAALLAGCVDQAREVRSYREVLDEHRPRPRPLAPSEALTLERAMALANADNEQLASQGETYLQALIAKNRAAMAFLPLVSFQPNFTVEQAPRGSAEPVSPGAPALTAAAATASQGGYVQDGGILRRLQAPVVGAMTFSIASLPAYRAAGMTAVQQRQLLLDAQATVLLNVAQTYYQVLISERQRAVLEHSVALQRERVREMRARYSYKLALGLDVAQAEAAEAGASVDLSRAGNDARNARRTLALLIGAPAVEGPLSDRPLAPAQPAPLDFFLGRALTSRPDLLAARAALKAARFAADAAVAEYYPSVSLSAAGFLYEQNYANASKWNGILSASLPIFNGGIRDDVRQAWSRLRQAALAESYLRRQIDQGIRSAYDNFLTSGLEQTELESEVEAAAEAYSQARQLAGRGLALPLDALVAQDALLNAQLQAAAAAFGRDVLYLDLIRASGNLHPETPGDLQAAAPPRM